MDPTERLESAKELLKGDAAGAWRALETIRADVTPDPNWPAATRATFLEVKGGVQHTARLFSEAVVTRRALIEAEEEAGEGPVGLGYSWRSLAESLQEARNFAAADEAWARARELVAAEPAHLRSIAFYEGQAQTRHDRREQAAAAYALACEHVAGAKVEGWFRRLYARALARAWVSQRKDTALAKRVREAFDQALETTSGTNHAIASFNLGQVLLLQRKKKDALPLLLRAVGALDESDLPALRLIESADVSLDHELALSPHLLGQVGKLTDADDLLLEGLRRVAAKADTHLGPVGGLVLATLRRFTQADEGALWRSLRSQGAEPRGNDPDWMSRVLVGESALTGRTTLTAAVQELSPLHAARVFKELAPLGLDPNGVDANGNRPLLVAAARGEPKLINVLIKAGADPNGEANGLTPLHVAVHRSASTVSSLLKAGAEPDRFAEGQAPLHSLVQWPPAWVPGAKRLLKDANLDLPDDRGDSALHIAADRLSVDPAASTHWIRALLKAGADPAVRDRAGQSARECIERVNPELVR